MLQYRRASGSALSDADSGDGINGLTAHPECRTLRESGVRMFSDMWQVDMCQVDGASDITQEKTILRSNIFFLIGSDIVKCEVCSQLRP